MGLATHSSTDLSDSHDSWILQFESINSYIDPEVMFGISLMILSIQMRIPMNFHYTCYCVFIYKLQLILSTSNLSLTINNFKSTLDIFISLTFLNCVYIIYNEHDFYK